ERRARAIQTIASFEQRLIEGAAVVSDQHAELRQMRSQSFELAGFFSVIAHEKLSDAKPIGRDTTHSDQKRAGAGAACKTGRLGVEKGPLIGGRVRYRTGGNGFEQ